MSLIVNKGISVDGFVGHILDVSPYGTTLPARNTLAVLPLVIFQSNPTESITLNVYDPLVDSDFTFSIQNKDGVYLSYLFAVPTWTAGALNDGDIVFDLNTNTLKKRIAGVLIAITIESLLTEAIETGSIYHLVTTAITIKRDAAELEKLKKLEEYLDDVCEYNEYIKIKTDVDYIKTLRICSFIEFARSNYSIAHTNLITANSFADKLIETLS
jgi:hypothetical protein